jgi:hypothetical protein
MVMTMRERGIHFNREMVRAVMEGRKMQTRRIIQSPAKNMQANGQKVIDYREPGDKWYGEHVFSMRNQSGTWCDYTKEQFLAKCPFGAVGDRLWVRETFRVFDSSVECACEDHCSCSRYHGKAIYRANGDDQEAKWTPSIHMPRKHSRITLEITNVGVQRLQSISQNDAVREGLVTLPASGRYCINQGDQYFGGASHDAREVFSWLWSSIYGEESWSDNPYVWVIEFRRIEQ